MRGERPRSPSAYTSRSRPRASEQSLRKATARVARASRTFAGRSRSCNGHPPHRYRSHGARRKRATTNDDPALGRWLGGATGRAAQRSRGSTQARRREVALTALTIRGRSPSLRERPEIDPFAACPTSTSRCSEAARLHRRARSSSLSPPSRSSAPGLRAGGERGMVRK